MVSEITISKGGISVTIYSQQVDYNLSNKLFLITPAQTSNNQSGGPKDTKVVDLLRITESYLIKGNILNKTDKDNLKLISQGANTSGGVITMIYDGDTIEGYIEKLTVTEKANDEPTSVPDDYAKYEVSITFTEGVSV